MDLLLRLVPSLAPRTQAVSLLSSSSRSLLRRAFASASVDSSAASSSSSTSSPPPPPSSSSQGSTSSGEGVSFAEAIGLVPKRLRATPSNLPFSLRDRTRPGSPSFYTGLQSSTYHDFLLLLQRRIEALKLKRAGAEDEFYLTPDVFPTWITKDDLQSRLNCRLRTTQYRTIVSKLNEIYSQPNGAEESEFLAKFRRSVEVKEKKTKVREVDAWGRMYALGRRKNSVAQVYLSEGTGEVLVNGKELHNHFTEFRHRDSVIAPLYLLNKLDSFNVWIKTSGGGPTGQAEASRLGLARALEYWSLDNRPSLKQAGFLTRDVRTVEPKKPGRKKARKLKQWVKR